MIFVQAKTQIKIWKNRWANVDKNRYLHVILILKACVCYFYQFFYFFNQMIVLQKLWKVLFVLSKNPFRSWDIQIFVFPSLPLFRPVGYCFRGWSVINLKLYDAINCLNKNSITHFVWYLEKEKRYDIETLSRDVVSNKEHFYRKIMQNMCTKS